MKKLIMFLAVTTSLLFAASPAAPSSSDILRQVEPPKDLPKKMIPLVEVGGKDKFAPAMKDDKSGKTIFVKAFKITGAINMQESKLQELLSSYTNRDLTFKELTEAASIITKAYRASGYFVARAYIPVQNMQDGIVEIAVIEGSYGKFKLNNTSNVKDSVVQGMLDDVKEKHIVSVNTIERAMLIINDTPGAKITSFDVMPGEQIGTSDFAVKTEATPFCDGYILSDNYGSRYTGKYRVMAGVNLNSVAGIGDKLSLSGLLSNGTDLRNGRIAYSAPAMPNGLRAEVGYSTTNYYLSEEYESLNADGKSKTVDLTLSYPIIRTRLETLKVIAILASKDLTDYQDEVITSDKEITSLSIELSHSKDQKLFGLISQINSGLTLTSGKLTFTDDTSKVADEAGANTQGKYNKINGYIGTSTILNQDMSLNTTLRFQKALGHKNLDGSEDFSIGGSYGVKVYPAGELSAENGFMLNIELFKNLPTYQNISHKVGLLYDMGKVSMEDDSNDVTFESKTLQDIGLVYNASYKQFFAKAQAARVVGGERVVSEPEYKTRILFQLGLIF